MQRDTCGGMCARCNAAVCPRAQERSCWGRHHRRMPAHREGRHVLYTLCVLCPCGSVPSRDKVSWARCCGFWESFAPLLLVQVWSSHIYFEEVHMARWGACVCCEIAQGGGVQVDTSSVAASIWWARRAVCHRRAESGGQTGLTLERARWVFVFWEGLQYDHFHLGACYSGVSAGSSGPRGPQ